MTRRRWLVAGLAAAALLLVGGRTLAGWFVERAWYASVGAEALWRERLRAVLTLQLGSAAAATFFLFANLYAVRLSVVSLVLPRRVGNLEIGEEVPGRALVGTAALLSLALGALLTLPADRWLAYVLARDGRPFGEVDPYFQADLSFFVEWLPFETALYEWALLVLGVSSGIVVLLYALTPSLRMARTGFYVSAYVRRHLTVLGGVLLLLLAWGYRLDLYGLLSAGTGPGGAFGWLDHQVGVPGLLLLAITTFGVALVVVWTGWNGQTRLAFFAVTAVIVLSLFVRYVLPLAATRMVAADDPSRRERPYLDTRAAYTRRAFGVDRIETDPGALGFASLADAARGSSAWDARALLRAVRGRDAVPRGEELVGWIATPAGLAAVVPALPEEAVGRAGGEPWRLSRVDVAHVLESGAPRTELVAGAESDRPATSHAPVVFPGASPYVVLADSGDRVQGVSVRGTVARLAHAWALQNPALLSADAVPGVRPELLRRRDVRERVRAVAPFFTQGTRVAPAIAGDTLFWLLHLYATSDHYPLAERTVVAGDRRNYLRHAAVAVVHAGTGRVGLVADRDADPLAASWIQRFPSLFRLGAQSLPPGVVAALGANEDALVAQAYAFSRYGERADRPGRRRTVLLEPQLLGADDSVAAGHPPPMTLDGASTALALPVLDEQDRVAGTLVATGGLRRRTVWLPLAAPGPNWDAVLGHFRDREPTGDRAQLRGAVRPIPLRTGIAFVQSRYRVAADGTPALAQVAVVTGDTVRHGPTLAAVAGSPPPGGALAAIDLETRAAELYVAMRRALARGDWSAFGQAFDSLGRVLGGARP